MFNKTVIWCVVYWCFDRKYQVMKRFSVDHRKESSVVLVRSVAPLYFAELVKTKLTCVLRTKRSRCVPKIIEINRDVLQT